VQRQKALIGRDPGLESIYPSLGQKRPPGETVSQVSPEGLEELASLGKAGDGECVPGSWNISSQGLKVRKPHILKEVEVVLGGGIAEERKRGLPFQSTTVGPKINLFYQ
jgi:hypothetical protein